MKRIFSPRRVLAFLLAVCLMLPVTACNGIMGEVEQKNDELVIWVWDNYLDNACLNFQVLHPEIKVTVEDHSNMERSEFIEKLSAALIAGKGPDIIPVNFFLQGDRSVEKMMRDGVFADMSEYFADFDWSGYLQPVIQKGVVDEKRYLVPLDYMFPLLLTSRPALEESGFQAENCVDYLSFLEECQKYLESQPEDNVRRLFEFPRTLGYFFCGLGNLSWVDYEKGTVDLSFPELKKAVEAYKPLYEQEQAESANDIIPPEWARRNCPEYLFRENINNMGGDISMDGLLLNTLAVDNISGAVLFPVRNQHGGISVLIRTAAGVRNNSANKELAAEFIQYLLEEDTQVGHGHSFNFWPVSKNALWKGMRYCGGNGTDISYGNSETYRFEKGLSDEIMNAVSALTEEIDSAYFRSPYDAEFYDTFRPYWEGKSSYEDCAAAFEKRAQIFISE